MLHYSGYYGIDQVQSDFQMQNRGVFFFRYKKYFTFFLPKIRAFKILYPLSTANPQTQQSALSQNPTPKNASSEKSAKNRLRKNISA
ncbi:MAG: hypothetical protein LBG87_09815 [Spirochaetaceae bacterium]|jgi:hypothetical protein|nr:hypothetical protein [Spirochaetaceae bacterium]